MTEPVYCESCDGNWPDNKNRPTWRWLCMFTPNRTNTGYVTRNYYDKDEPLKRCTVVNWNGECDKFKPRKDDNDGDESDSG